jgi:hypothetical protein
MIYFEKIKQFFKKKSFTLFFLGIIFLSIFLRFFRFPDRYGFALDQSHDMLVAQYALQIHSLPLLGPFSSAGPFQTGGEWYWIIMLGMILFHGIFLGPWIFTALLSVAFVIIIVFLGEILMGKKFGLVVGLLSAVSVAEISQSVNLTNQAPIAFFSLLSLYFSILYLQKKSSLFLFFTGIFIATAFTIHLQGVLLLLLLPPLFIFSGVPSIKSIVFLLTGIFLPCLPIFIFDVYHGFTNINHMLYYYRYDQYHISFEVLGRRWLTYLGVFIPHAWGYIISDTTFMGYPIILYLLFLFPYLFFKQHVASSWKYISITTILMLFALRYTRTPLFASYLMFLHPFIILLTGYVIFFLIQKTRFIGLLLLIIIVFISIKSTISEALSSVDTTPILADKWMKKIQMHFPKKQFSLYDFQYKHTNNSFPLVVFLSQAHLISENGIKLGIDSASTSASNTYPVILDEKNDGIEVINLNSLTKKTLANKDWGPVNPSTIYNQTENWYKN